LQPDGEPSRPEDRQRQRLILALILFVIAIGVVAYKVITTAGGSQSEVEQAAPVAPAEPVPSNGASSSAAPGNESRATAAAAPGSGDVAHGSGASGSGAAGSKVADSGVSNSGVTQGAGTNSKTARASHEKLKSPVAAKAAQGASEAAAAPVVTRKVLPPLAVEVYAGGRPVPLSSKPAQAVHVDTSNGVLGRATVPGSEGTVAGGTDSASGGRVKISAEALQVLSHPVDPNYPLLAREMKVQGSVILDAYIGRDGTIQALKIVSGPTILANAAMEAVRQWKFKPYLQAGQAVETEARITVNFTISTT
jgi:TonB family protein